MATSDEHGSAGHPATEDGLSEHGVAQPAAVVRQALRTPRSAAVAGIAFSLLFTIGVVLVRSSMPADPADAGLWLSDADRRQTVLRVLGLAPFAGIAFLWFIAVVRDRIGQSEDRFFATVFLGSGLLFVAMLFTSTAVTAALVSSAGEDSQRLIDSGAWSLGRHVAVSLMQVFGMRMAAVFMIATSTILLRTGAGPRWIAYAGFAIAVVLLGLLGFFSGLELLFPAWVMVLSLYILVESFRPGRPARS
jgi:hypothetical protein